MRVRSRLTAAFLITGAAFALASCDKKSPTSPPNPQPGLNPTIARIEIVGPSEIEPGESVQLTANAIKSNGSVENVSGKVEWAVRSVTTSAVLSLTGAGLVTGRERGEAVVTVRLDGLTDDATILVLPRGTFRLAGTISENSLGLENVTVTVISGIGEGLTALTDAHGNYALYGLAGSVRIRATRDGYVDRTEQVNVTAHAVHSFEMAPTRPRDHTGTYTLTVTAGEVACNPGSPDVLKRRVYTASVEQKDADLKVSLSGADFIGNSFRGAVAPTGEIVFSIRPASIWDYDGPDVVERLSDGTSLCVAGTIIGRGTPTGISGTVDHSRGGTIFLCSGSYTSHSGCSIDRFEMVRR